MAIISNSNTEKVTKRKVKDDTFSLNKEELEFLLNVIASSKFEGKDVQIVYETAVKLQTQILDL